MPKTETASTGQTYGLKQQLRALKMKAKEKGGESSRAQIAQLKQRLRQEKAKSKYGGALNKAPDLSYVMKPAQLQTEMAKLQKKVQALVKAVKAKPA